MTVSARATPGRNVAMSARAAPPANTLKRFLVSMLPPRRGWGWRKHAFGVLGGAITFGKFREYGRLSRVRQTARAATASALAAASPARRAAESKRRPGTHRRRGQ